MLYTVGVPGFMLYTLEVRGCILYILWGNRVHTILCGGTRVHGTYSGGTRVHTIYSGVTRVHTIYFGGTRVHTIYSGGTRVHTRAPGIAQAIRFSTCVLQSTYPNPTKQTLMLTIGRSVYAACSARFHYRGDYLCSAWSVLPNESRARTNNCWPPKGKVWCPHLSQMHRRSSRGNTPNSRCSCRVYRVCIGVITRASTRA